MNVGKWIRQVCEDRLITSDDIALTSSMIAQAKRHQEYYISEDSLSQIEAGLAPSIHQIYSLAVCLKVPCEQLLRLFGIDLEKTWRNGMQSAPPQTDLPSMTMNDHNNHRDIRLNFDSQISLRETYLLGPDPERWGNVPTEVQKRLQPAHYRYAVVGFKDDTMADILPPGSLLEIDQEQREVRRSPGKSSWGRPIYLVQHLYGYSCCWCQHDGDELTLVPHPLSRQKAMHFKIPHEALIIGKVVNVWTPAQLDSLLPESMESYSSQAAYPAQKYGPQSVHSGSTELFRPRRSGLFIA